MINYDITLYVHRCQVGRNQKQGSSEIIIISLCLLRVNGIYDQISLFAIKLLQNFVALEVLLTLKSFLGKQIAK